MHTETPCSGSDLLIRNARFHTQNPLQPLASSIRIRGNRIDEVSTGELPAAGATVIDAQGATIAPGFNDVHAHSIWFGLGQLELNLEPVTSLGELYSLIADQATNTDVDEWIIATGFSHIRVGEVYPDRDALDRAAGGRPVWLKHSSGHSAFVNGVALHRIAAQGGLDAEIDGGVVVRDEHGRPTGLLEENAMTLVQSLTLPYPTETLVSALDLATRQYLREGITSVTDAGIAGGWIGHSPRELFAYQSARARGLLHTRMQPMFIIDALHPVPGHAGDPRGAHA